MEEQRRVFVAVWLPFRASAKVRQWCGTLAEARWSIEAAGKTGGTHRRILSYTITDEQEEQR